MHLFNRNVLTFAFLLLASPLAFAQDAQKLDPVSDVYAITNVNIIQAPGRKIDFGTVIVRNGLIHTVGKNVSLPPDAIVINADSMYLYAGFIDGLSHAGVDKPSHDVHNGKPKDPGSPPAERAGITPQCDVRNFLNPGDKSVAELRSVGFTVAHVVPHGVFLPGKGAVISLAEGTSADGMVLVSNASLYSELTWTHGVYPSTVMGVMAKWRELYQQAVLARSYQTMYASGGSGLERPTIDRVLESFYPVIERKVPVFFKVEKNNDIHRVLALQKEFGFSLMTGEIKEGWNITGKMKAAGAKAFLSLELPEGDVHEEKKGEGSKEQMVEEPGREKKTTVQESERQRLETRKAEFNARYVNQAKAFYDAGVKFGFSTMNVKAKDIHRNLRRIVASGLPEDAVLAALTIHPAEMLGLADKMGTVDKGKIANLVISDKPYFSEKIKVRYVFVDGKPYECGWKDKKKFLDKKAAGIEGAWSLTTETPQGKIDMRVVFNRKSDAYTGSISGERLPGSIDFSRVELEGNKLKFVYSATIEADTVEVTVEGVVEGTSFKGNMQVGKFGVFPVEGSKEPKL